MDMQSLALLGAGLGYVSSITRQSHSILGKNNDFSIVLDEQIREISTAKLSCL